MPRPKLAVFWVFFDSLKGLFVSFRHHRIGAAFGLALAIFLIAIVFSFLAFSPVLSPFVYPLF